MPFFWRCQAAQEEQQQPGTQGVEGSGPSTPLLVKLFSEGAAWSQGQLPEVILTVTAFLPVLCHGRRCRGLSCTR